MTWWTAATEIAGVALDLGQVAAEHTRANHLHKEAVAQALRIHEQEAQATKAYHRVDIKQNNRIHARELLQSQLQHVEEMDAEKRVAIRQNVRDDWEQITGKAETVLIVNTLMLGVGFAMLIEGTLPDHTAISMPVVPTLYFSLLAAAICELLLSVRLAMILRFRVGRMVVKEMRRAIIRARALEHSFRQYPSYVRSNIPECTVPACDDARFRQAVQPITSRAILSIASDDVPAFIHPGGERCEADSGESQGHVTAGFSLRSGLGCPQRSFRCRHRHRPDGGDQAVSLKVDSPQTAHLAAKPLPHCSFRPSALDEDDLGCSVHPLPQSRPSLRRQDTTMSARSTASARSSVSNVESAMSSGSRTEPERELQLQPQALQGPREAAIDEDALEVCEATDDELQNVADAHSQMLQAREHEDSEFTSRLEELRRLCCKPYDKASQQSFFHGTALLFASACVYAFATNQDDIDSDGMLYEPSHALDGRQASHPTQHFAGYAFVVSAFVTFGGLLYMEVVNKREKDRATQHKGRETWSVDAVSPRRTVFVITLALLLNSVLWVLVSGMVPLRRGVLVVRGRHLEPVPLPPFFQPTRATFDQICKCVVIANRFGDTLGVSLEDGSLVASPRTDDNDAARAACVGRGPEASPEIWAISRSLGGESMIMSLDRLPWSSILTCAPTSQGNMMWFRSKEDGVLAGGRLEATNATHATVTDVKLWSPPAMPEFCSRCEVVDAEITGEALVVLLRGGHAGRHVLTVVSIASGRRTFTGYLPRGRWLAVAGTSRSIALLGDEGEMFLADASSW